MALPNTSGIYRIVYTRNGDEYIGSAVNFRRRWDLHKSRLKAGTHHSKYMQRVYNKYGLDVLEFEPIEELPLPPGYTKKQKKARLIPIEQEWMDERQPAMNGNKTAGNMLGFKHSEETKRKLSEAGKGRKHTEESKALIRASAMGHTRNLGRQLSEEHKLAIGKGNKGRVVSEETKAKQSASQQKRFDDPAEREKIAAARRGTKASDEARANMSAASPWKGKKRPPGWSENLSEKLTGHPVSQETRDKISAANKAVNERKRLEAEQKAQEGLDGDSSTGQATRAS